MGGGGSLRPAGPRGLRSRSLSPTQGSSETSLSPHDTGRDLLSLPVTDVGSVLAFFSCSLRSSLDAAVSGCFSSGGARALCGDPALPPLPPPGCRPPPTWGRVGHVGCQPGDTGSLTVQGHGALWPLARNLCPSRGRCTAPGSSAGPSRQPRSSAAPTEATLQRPSEQPGNSGPQTRLGSSSQVPAQARSRS